MRTMTLVFVLVCCSVCSMPLFGELVTGGSIQITGALPSGIFTLSGTSFNATGNFSIGNWGATQCNPCVENTVLGVYGYESGNDLGNGTATINGNTFPYVTWGDLNAHGPSIFMITGPSIVLSKGAGTYVSTFSFTGSLCGTIDPSGVCAASLPSLTGSGQVDVQIESFISNGQDVLEYTQASYTFLPTPEPGSFLLLGSGVLGLAAVIRRKVSL